MLLYNTIFFAKSVRETNMVKRNNEKKVSYDLTFD